MATLQRYGGDKDWWNAAQTAGNLSELRLTLGKVSANEGSSVNAASEAVAHADRSERKEQAFYQRANLANAQHQAGHLEKASELFVEAEAMQKNLQPNYPQLYSLRGYQYCDLLLSYAAQADVHQRSLKLIEWRLPDDSLLDIALDTLSLGRATLALGKVDDARASLETAVDALRTAGGIDDVPHGLLARAELHRLTGAYDLASADLGEVYDIATRSHMRLFETDALLEHARLTLARAAPDALDAAKSLAARAKAIIDDTGYKRRIPDWHLVMARIAATRADKAAATPHLVEAQKWIDQGWRCHVAEHAAISKLLGAPEPRKSLWQRFFG